MMNIVFFGVEKEEKNFYNEKYVFYINRIIFVIIEMIIKN